MSADLSRRSLLRAGVLGGASFLGGCVSGEDSPTKTTMDSNSTGTTSHSGITGTPYREWSIESDGLKIYYPRIQHGIATFYEDAISIFDAQGQWFLCYVEDTSDDPAPRPSFSLSFDGQKHNVVDLQRPLYRAGQRGEGLYVRGTGKGELVFDLPESTTNSNVRLTWPGGTWTPPQVIIDRLIAELPEFEVDVSAPNTVTTSESPTLSLTVRNTGAIHGQFLFGLNRIGPDVAYTPVRRFILSIDPGGTARREFTVTGPFDGDGSARDVIYKLLTPTGEQITRTISPGST